MRNMDGLSHPFWQKVVTGTLHCGAGCVLADLVGPFLFRAVPFTLFGSRVYGEWTLDFVLALIVGVVSICGALPNAAPNRRQNLVAHLQSRFLVFNGLATRYVRLDGVSNFRLVRRAFSASP